MSHDPRHASSLPRPPAPSIASLTRPPAGFYPVRIVEIKRRKPSTRASAHLEEQQPVMNSSPLLSSPTGGMGGPETASTTPSPRRAGEIPRTDGSTSRDVPPPPPLHSPGQRSINIARGSYMDYESNTSPSRPAHFSQPFQQTSPAHHAHQHQDDSNSRASPVTAIHAARAGRSFRYDVENKAIPHQSAPPPPPPRRQREEYDPRRLFPAAVRPPQSFRFELEEVPTQHHSSEPHIPGRFPSSPQPMDTNEYPEDSPMGGVQDDSLPKLRSKAGSYREIHPYELGMVYSNPAQLPASTSSSDTVQQDTVYPEEPFLFEVRSPRKGTHDGSNKQVATSRQAAYYARNPAHEAETVPLLRRLRADERYATSFRTERGESLDHGGSVERGGGAERGRAQDYGREGGLVDEAMSTGDTDAMVFEMEKQTAERSSKQ